MFYDRIKEMRVARRIPNDELFVDSVLHATDRSEAGLSAFFHALAITAHSGADLTLLHPPGRRSTDSFAGFPSVRGTIEKWRRHSATDSIVEKLKRSRVSKLDVNSPDPVAASMSHVSRHGSGMIVLAVEGRHGRGRSVQSSRAVRLARLSGRPTLFVPNGSRPFVSAATGQIWLRRILLPIDAETDPRPTMMHALRSASLLDDPALEITLLQVGTSDEADMTDLPHLPFCKWTAVRRGGEQAEQILALAGEIRADVIYMPTAWGWPAPTSPSYGVMEAVLEGSTCPVATVPVDRGVS